MSELKECNFKPVGNYLVIEMDEAEKEQKTEGGLILATAKGATNKKPNTATILAVGNGIEETTNLKRGSKVVISQFSIFDVLVNGKEYKMTKVDDLLGYV